ncbi:uncharacterized protein LAESUDRAFT_713657 [Laetiporus sulphureus 93-53]|uniref:Uncharacterized protein n=1 Tax=Laetiporus sulphureus 93-53 TaxID=1314785 RepID=A0A165EIZ0_9APHY|nr:uncharacterized protein LAESUDRAFT_713657 [Laetiporus sulphureus 93-53]KZT07147.1 hypothetical protein LAESUDRAFT_713657 [Laetiporus sulphureus 93-53]
MSQARLDTSSIDDDVPMANPEYYEVLATVHRAHIVHDAEGCNIDLQFQIHGATNSNDAFSLRFLILRQPPQSCVEAVIISPSLWDSRSCKVQYDRLSAKMWWKAYPSLILATLQLPTQPQGDSIRNVEGTRESPAALNVRVNVHARILPGTFSQIKGRTRAALAGLLLEGQVECNMETIVIRGNFVSVGSPVSENSQCSVHHLSQLEGRGLRKRHEEYICNALMKERRHSESTSMSFVLLFNTAGSNFIEVTPITAGKRTTSRDWDATSQKLRAQAMQESEERLEILLQLRRYLAMYENHQGGELVLDIADAYATPGVITSDELKEIPEKIKGMLEDLHRHSTMVGPFLEILKTIAGIP